MNNKFIFFKLNSQTRQIKGHQLRWGRLCVMEDQELSFHYFMSELPTVYPNGQVRYEIVRSGVQKRDLVEELNLGAFSILMVFTSMSHILCSSHITGVWFYSSDFPIHLPFCQHLYVERKTLIRLLSALKTQPQLRRKSRLNIELHNLATIYSHFT